MDDVISIKSHLYYDMLVHISKWSLCKTPKSVKMFWTDELKNLFHLNKIRYRSKNSIILYKITLPLTACSDGYYGYNCKETCSLTCGVPGGCDRATGSCYDGCLSGWKGSMCEHGNYCAQPMIVFFFIYKRNSYLKWYNAGFNLWIRLMEYVNLSTIIRRNAAIPWTLKDAIQWPFSHHFGPFSNIHFSFIPHITNLICFIS